MKNLLIRILFCFLLITATGYVNYIYAQQKDSTTNTIVQERSVEDDEFNLFLLVFALAVVCFMAGCMIVGIVITILCLLLILALVSFGVISVSVLAGYYKRSVSAGFKTFIMISSCLAGMLAGLVGFTLIVKLFKLDVSQLQMLLTGSISGAIGGLLLGWAAYKITGIGLKWGVEKLKSL